MSDLKELRCFNPTTGERDGGYCAWEGGGKCMKCEAADEIDAYKANDEIRAIEFKRLTAQLEDANLRRTQSETTLWKRIAELEDEISRLRQHCHKISAEMGDKAAQERIAELEGVEEALEHNYGVMCRAQSKSLTKIERLTAHIQTQVAEHKALDRVQQEEIGRITAHASSLTIELRGTVTTKYHDDLMQEWKNLEVIHLKRIAELEAKVEDAFNSGFCFGESNEIDQDEAWDYYAALQEVES